jgi:sulfonate transport system substrate-binding protein
LTSRKSEEPDDIHAGKDTQMALSRRAVIQGLAALGVVPALGLSARGVAAQELPATVRLDYAYYNPSSLVMRRFGWLDEALA